MSLTEKSKNRITLIGFSGTGKSSVARLVADRLGWTAVDIDSDIEKLAGKSIPLIFSEDGEAAFRAMEKRLLSAALEKQHIVLATGGGITTDPENRVRLLKQSTVICLEALPEMILRRLRQENEFNSSTVRPLLNTINPLKRIRELKAKRQQYYSGVHWTVQTDMLSHEEVCGEVIRGWQIVTGRTTIYRTRKNEKVVSVRTSGRTYPVFTGWGILNRLGARLKECGISGKVVVITDETVHSYHGRNVIRGLEKSGFTVYCLAVPPGEKSKTIGQAVNIYDFLIENKVERTDAIIALGGGMIGDLAGFAAATYLRGVPLIQLPTSLLAMTDASIGGKVAVDHLRGKNLIGSFYQPHFVLCDVSVLKTLPQRELTSGWAEVIKYGAILDSEFLRFLRKNSAKLLSLEQDAAVEAVHHSASIKGMIVTEDEKETGRRILLNFGHTIAHGIENATAYDCFLHGEAVAVGMNGAARLSNKLGLLSGREAERIEALLKKFGLPVQCSGISIQRVKEAMQYDKKVRNRAIRWVLLDAIGNAVVRNDVPDGLIDAVLNEVILP